jgi:hypothetical protein
MALIGSNSEMATEMAGGIVDTVGGIAFLGSEKVWLHIP